MRVFWLYLLVMVLCARLLGAEPVRFILNTDLASDCDDAGAVAMVNTMMDAGLVKPLAMMVSTGGPHSAPTLCAIDTWYGHGDIPIGTLKNPGFWAGGSADAPSGATNYESYTQTIAATCPTRLKSGDDAPDAVALYRKVLAAQPDRSVVIGTIGPLINLTHLLASKPDEVSPLGGADLVKAKVKLLVISGGRNPAGTSSNFSKAGAGPYAKGVIEGWPGPVVFNGNEVGEKLETGWGVNAAANEGNPARLAYKFFFKGDETRKRASSDEVGVLYAIAGAADMFTLIEGGFMECTASGRTRWALTPQAGKSRAYLAKAPGSDAKITEAIESWMTKGRRS